jgi:hypothetical protein
VCATPEDDLSPIISEHVEASQGDRQRKNPEKNGKNRVFLSAAPKEIG